MKVKRGLASQASVIVGGVAVTTFSQLTVTLAGTFANTGAVVSLTLIVCEAVAELPQASVAVQVLTTV